MRSGHERGERYQSTIASAVFFFASVAVLSMFMGCGDDGGTTCTTCGSENELVFTREDTSEIAFPSSAEAFVWCEDWEAETVEVPALHIWFGSTDPEEPYWSIRAVVADIELDQPLSFPIIFVWDQPEGVEMFLNDPPNELSSGQSESSGTITFHVLPCPGGNTVEFTIDAVLGSELGDLSPVAVTGYFRHDLAAPPNGTE